MLDFKKPITSYTFFLEKKNSNQFFDMIYFLKNNIRINTGGYTHKECIQKLVSKKVWAEIRSLETENQHTNTLNSRDGGCNYETKNLKCMCPKDGQVDAEELRVAHTWIHSQTSVNWGLKSIVKHSLYSTIK